jgi:hypothetical protein
MEHNVRTALVMNALLEDFILSLVIIPEFQASIAAQELREIMVEIV